MRGGARVLPGARCFRGAAVLGVGGGCLRNLSAALSLRSVRRRVLSGLCTVFCGGHSACRTLRRTFMPGARQNY